VLQGLTVGLISGAAARQLAARSNELGIWSLKSERIFRPSMTGA